MSDRELDIIGASDSHGTLVHALEAGSPCKILDAPSGTGVLARRLVALGYDVHCADIDKGNFQLDDVPFTSVNLNRAIDLPDSEFDAVVCANGVHRLFNLKGCLGEFGRVLKPGGTLFVNVNNYASIKHRLRFLLYGSLDNAVNISGCRQTTDDPEANVRIALHMPLLVNQLELAGFEIVSVKPAAVRLEHRLLAPVAWVFRLLSMLIPGKSRKRNHLRWSSGSGVLPGGRYLLIEARKLRG